MLSSRRILAAACWLAAAPTVGVAQTNEEEAVRAAVQLYFDGVTKNDSLALRRVFLPEAQLMFARANGTLFVTSFEDWVAFTRRPADPAGKVNRVISIDVTGSAAVAKTELDWPTVRYVDYLSLLKVGDAWRIAHKIWWQESKRASRVGPQTPNGDGAAGR